MKVYFYFHFHFCSSIFQKLCYLYLGSLIQVQIEKWKNHLCAPLQKNIQLGSLLQCRLREKADSIRTSRQQQLTLESSWASNLGQPWAQAAPNQFGIGQTC